ncbi:hypothetical protein NL676_037295 [Syzygium grande]|nr:hypothetical protein NL676_037295 [Syzygium grande]
MEGAQGKAKRRVAGQFARDGFGTGAAETRQLHLPPQSCYFTAHFSSLPRLALRVFGWWGKGVGGGSDRVLVQLWCMVWFGVVGHMKGVNSNLRGRWPSNFFTSGMSVRGVAFQSLRAGFDQNKRRNKIFDGGIDHPSTNG